MTIHGVRRVVAKHCSQIIRVALGESGHSLRVMLNGLSARQDDVLRLSAALREAGIEAELDLHHVSESVDWTRWGPAKAAEYDFVLVVPSQRWRTSWEGGGDPTKGAGTAAEADALRSLYARNRDEFLNKVRLVMLPGSTDADIPDGLHGVPRFKISTFDATGIEELLRSLTAQARFPKAALGAVEQPCPFTRGLGSDESEGEARDWTTDFTPAASATALGRPTRQGAALPDLSGARCRPCCRVRRRRLARHDHGDLVAA